MRYQVQALLNRTDSTDYTVSQPDQKNIIHFDRSTGIETQNLLTRPLIMEDFKQIMSGFSAGPVSAGMASHAERIATLRPNVFLTNWS